MSESIKDFSGCSVKNIKSPYINFEINIPGIEQPAKFLIPKELKTDAQWCMFDKTLAAYIDSLRKLQMEKAE